MLRSSLSLPLLLPRSPRLVALPLHNPSALDSRLASPSPAFHVRQFRSRSTHTHTQQGLQDRKEASDLLAKRRRLRLSLLPLRQVLSVTSCARIPLTLVHTHTPSAAAPTADPRCCPAAPDGKGAGHRDKLDGDQRVFAVPSLLACTRHPHQQLTQVLHRVTAHVTQAASPTRAPDFQGNS